jgi:hypothetical protein
MSDDPFRLGGPRPAPMTFWKTVWAVAFGIILSSILVFMLFVGIGLTFGLSTRWFIERAKSAARQEETEQRRIIEETRRKLDAIGETNVTIEVERRRR